VVVVVAALPSCGSLDGTSSERSCGTGPSS